MGNHDKSRDASNEKQGGYGNWAFFGVANIGLAAKALGILGQNKLDNLNITTHGREFKYSNGSQTSLAYDNQSDLDANTYLLRRDINSYNRGSGTDKNKEIRQLSRLFSFVKEGGNCVFSVCGLGEPSKDAGTKMAQSLFELSGGVINIYLSKSNVGIPLDNGGPTNNAYNIDGQINNYNRGWYQVSPQQGKSEGNITNIKQIILHTTGNAPIEFK